MLVETINPTQVGHDDDICEFSPQLQLFGWEFDVGFTSIVFSLTKDVDISLTDDVDTSLTDDVDTSLTDDVDTSLTYIENEMKQF